MSTIPSYETISPERRDFIWTSFFGGLAAVVFALLVDGWTHTYLLNTVVGGFIFLAFCDIFPEWTPSLLRPRPAMLPSIIAALALSLCFVSPTSLVLDDDDVTYVEWAKWRSPFSSSVLESAPPLQGELTLKQDAEDGGVVREDERAWFTVIVKYNVVDPHALSASEWKALKKGLPLGELPLSFDSAPELVVRGWLGRNLPHVKADIWVTYQSPLIVYKSRTP